MNRVIESKKISPQTLSSVGIAVHHVGLHVGVLYRVTKTSSVQILHLGGHRALASEHPSGAYVCWVRPSIEADRGMAIAALCRRIWKKHGAGGLPYGFSSPSEFFDVSGKRLVGPAKVGLTCASFVLSVFEAAGFPLAKYDSWPPPTPEDITRQRELLKQMSKDHPEDKEHIDEAEKEVGNTRYHPLQVAGAGTADKFPADHEYASRMASQIDDLLKQLRIEWQKQRASENSEADNPRARQ